MRGLCLPIYVSTIRGEGCVVADASPPVMRLAGGQLLTVVVVERMEYRTQQETARDDSKFDIIILHFCGDSALCPGLGFGYGCRLLI